MAGNAPVRRKRTVRSGIIVSSAFYARSKMVEEIINGKEPEGEKQKFIRGDIPRPFGVSRRSERNTKGDNDRWRQVPCRAEGLPVWVILTNEVRA